MNKLNKFDKAQQNKDLASINSNGEGFISQRATARLCGVSHGNIQYHLNKNSIGHFNTNEFNQLDENGCLLLVGYYAQKGNKTAIESTIKLMKAGIRAYIYTLAGQQSQDAAKDARIEQLQETLALEKAKPSRVVGVGSQVNRMTLHQQREALYNQGICDRIVKHVKHYYYPVNAEGERQGYNNIGRGITKTIDLK